MIARHWTGVAKRERAADYIDHLQTQTFPSVRKLAGFVDASILRRDVEDGVEFLIVTTWQSLDAIRAFAGDRVETAVVPERAQQMMIRYDQTVRHFEIVA
jgi:heme-degrading monooxygenase HmoA